MVLDTFSPAERLAFVLHDMFAVPFDDIGAIVGRSSNGAKQLASRARPKVQGSTPVPDVDPARRREVVDAFLIASRSGDFDALLALLDPDVVLQADSAAVGMGSPGELRGAAAVAGTFSGRALNAQPALIDGAIGAVWVVGGRPRVAWDLTIRHGKIVHTTCSPAPTASTTSTSPFSTTDGVGSAPGGEPDRSGGLLASTEPEPFSDRCGFSGNPIAVETVIGDTVVSRRPPARTRR